MEDKICQTALSRTTDGFETKDCTNDWEGAQRIDAECEAMAEADEEDI